MGSGTQLTPAEPVIIDLGFDRGPENDAAAPPTPRRRWSSLLAVAMFVVLTVAASAAPGPPPLRELVSVGTRLSDTFTVTDDVLLVHSPAVGELAAYDLRRGRLRWQVAAPAGYYRIRTAGGLVMLRTRRAGGGPPQLVALSADTGQLRWRYDGSVVAVANAKNMLGVSEVATLWGVSRGVDEAVVGLDAQTGRIRWTAAVPTTAVLQTLPGPPPRVLLVHDTGEAEVIDVDSGARVAVARLPATDYTPGNPAVAGGMVLLRHHQGSDLVISGFDVDTLTRRWTRPAVAFSDAQPCGGLACFTSRSGVRAIDPRDGGDRWSRPAWRAVDQAGRVVLAYGSGADGDDLVAIVDPATGRPVVGLRRWRAVPTTGEGDRVVVTRPAPVGDGLTVAVADPAGRTLRALGEVTSVGGSCRAAVPDRLVCRSIDGRITIWAYR